MCFQMFFLLFLIIVSVRGECPPNTFWLSQLNKCITVVQNGTKTSFSEADRECNVLGGQLTSIHNGFENAIILEYFREISVVEQTLIGATLVGATWMWKDGTPMNYTNWATGEPSPINKCAQMNHFNGLWYSIECNTTDIRYLCTIPFVQPTQGCPADWSSFKGNCYFYHDSYQITPYNWTSARNYCTQNGGDLVSIHSPEENKFVADLAQPENCFWYPETWIGLQWNTVYSWSDGSDVSYMSTTTHEKKPPLGYVISPSCHKFSGDWTDYEIKNTFYSFVCKKPKQ